MTGFYPRLRDERQDDEALQICIEKTADQLETQPSSAEGPGMLLGKIQSGKTRGFLGIIARAFDKGYEVAVVLTKGTVTLSTQTVKRIGRDYKTFVNGDEVIVFDIMEMPERLTRPELRRKMVIVAKKQVQNLERVIKLFGENYPELRDRRIDEDAVFPSEDDLETSFVENFKDPGFVAVCASAQNIDRIVTLYRACKRTGRTLLLDIYAMEVLRATGNENLPAPGWPNLNVYVPEYQRRHIAKNKLFDLLEPYKEARIYRDRITEIGDKAVMLFRRAMMKDVDMADLWLKGRVIWSQWDGYLKDNDSDGAKLKADLSNRGVSMDIIHTSGHASINDLKRLAAAIAPEALVPIHTFEGNKFPELFENVIQQCDGHWWTI